MWKAVVNLEMLVYLCELIITASRKLPVVVKDAIYACIKKVL
jgi:hypothetical protein